MPPEDDLQITTYPDGPILVRGPVLVLGEDGEEVQQTRRTIALCRCGRSRIRPFCDGTHKKIGFTTDEEAPARLEPVLRTPPS